jgi:hypothetical protein
MVRWFVLLCCCALFPRPPLRQPREYIKFTHPNYVGVTMGEAVIELRLRKSFDADLDPVGEAQSEPNHDPYLARPDRNPAPWQVATKGLNALERMRTLLIILCVVITLIVIIVPIALFFNGSI